VWVGNLEVVCEGVEDVLIRLDSRLEEGAPKTNSSLLVENPPIS
jgi:hypothetical protein